MKHILLATLRPLEDFRAGCVCEPCAADVFAKHEAYFCLKEGRGDRSQYDNMNVSPAGPLPETGHLYTPRVGKACWAGHIY